MNLNLIIDILIATVPLLVIFPSLFLSMALSQFGTLVMEAGGFCWF